MVTAGGCPVTGPGTRLGCEGVLAWLLENRVLPEKVPLDLGESLLKLTESKWHLKKYLFHRDKQWQPQPGKREKWVNLNRQDLG